MDYTPLLDILVKIVIFSIFISTIVETVKKISIIGFVGLFKDIWKTLIAGDAEMKSDSFPALAFGIALLCCWAFNATIMSSIFNHSSESLSGAQQFFSRWIDYFGTASVVHAGADKFFKKVLAAKRDAEEQLERE